MVVNKKKAPQWGVSSKTAERAQLEAFGANVRRERTRLGLTQEKLAEKVELHPRTVQKIEAGETNILLTTVLRFQNDTSLELSPDSHVSIIQLLPVNFVFEQDKGSVTYGNELQVPVSIRSFDLLTIVTRAVLSYTVDPTNQIVTISVKQGMVREGYEDAQNTSTVMTIKQGQTFVFDEKQKIGTIQ